MPPKQPPAPSSASDSDSDSGSTATSSSSEEQHKTAGAPAPPAAASKPSDDNDLGSDDEENSEDEAEEGSDDSDSPPKASVKPDKPGIKEVATAATAKPPPSDSDSESESSDSNTKPPPPRRPSRGPDPSIKPISSKPMDGSPKPKKGVAADKPKLPVASETSAERRKRKEPEAAEEEEATGNGPSGKKLFQRVWTEADEIAVLKGMIEFQAKHGADADRASAIDAFHEFIHRSLHLEFSKAQLTDKMRRLKKKYETNLRRSKKGAQPSFARPHEKAAFELSRKIWGGKRSSAPAVEDGAEEYGGDDMRVEDAEGKGEKKAQQRSRSAAAVASPGRGNSALGDSSLVGGKDGDKKVGALYPKLTDAVALLEGDTADVSLRGSLWRAVELLKPATAKALEESWSKHFMAGIKYFLKRSELKKELMKSLVEALESA